MLLDPNTMSCPKSDVPLRMGGGRGYPRGRGIIAVRVASVCVPLILLGLHAHLLN